MKALKEFGVAIKFIELHDDDNDDEDGSSGNTEEENVDFVEISDNESVVTQDNAPHVLPSHIRCASHTLSLVEPLTLMPYKLQEHFLV